MFTLTLDMACPGWQRARQKGKQFFTDDKTAGAKKRIADEYRLANGPYIEGPVRLHVRAEYEPPKSLSRPKRAARIGQWKETKPDIDNVLKLIGDALNGVAFKDDQHIADLATMKVWGERDKLTISVGPANG